MAGTVYKTAMVGIVTLIVFGGVMALVGYGESIYPLDRIRGHLDGITGSSDPEAIQAHLAAVNQHLATVMGKLDDTKNPVWIFPTESTNFLRIQADVDTMVAGIEQVSAVPKDSSAYHTGMMDISNRAVLLKANIMDATPYMYVSYWNVVYAALWIAAIVGIFAALKRKKEQIRLLDEAGGV